MPSLYLAHGLPSYALPNYPKDEDLNDAQCYVDMLSSLPENFLKPKAILCMSAHWNTINEMRITSSERPKTIHSFYGFPRELYEIQYPCAGSPEVAASVKAIVSDIILDDQWGLDHGSWTLLVHLYPDADVPVIELSVDNSKPPDYYFQLGRQLRGLRDEGVLIMGSGSIVHNLRNLKWGGPPHDWAIAFNEWVKDLVHKKEDISLLNYASAPGGRMSVPTPDHYYPLLFALGAAYDNDARKTLIDWIDNGANGMTSFSFGIN